MGAGLNGLEAPSQSPACQRHRLLVAEGWGWVAAFFSRPLCNWAALFRDPTAHLTLRKGLEKVAQKMPLNIHLDLPHLSFHRCGRNRKKVLQFETGNMEHKDPPGPPWQIWKTPQKDSTGCSWTESLQHRCCSFEWNQAVGWRFTNRGGDGLHLFLERLSYWRTTSAWCGTGH